MKKVKVTEYWRKGSRYIHPHATPWQVFKHKVRNVLVATFRLSVILAICFGIFKLGGLFNPAEVILPPTQVIKEVEVKAPILDRIADCESGVRTPAGKGVKGSARHYAPSGQVLMTGNTNKSVDVGKYAINSVWFKKATELGYDLTKEEDNLAMATWIYKNRGTEDWSASVTCWR